MNNFKKKIRFGARIISMLLVMIMLSEEFLGSGNIVLAAQQEELVVSEETSVETPATENTNEETTSEEFDTENLDILFEIEELREQSAKQYRLSDGTIMAAEYGMDIHYEENGKWKDIDNRFIYEAPSEQDSMEGFSTAEGNVKFKFAPNTGNGEVVRATTDGYSVGFAFISDDAEVLEEIDSTVSNLNDTEINITETEDITENASNEDDEFSPVSITFIKGDILNESEAEQALGNNETGAVSSYAANTISTTTITQEVEAYEDESPEVVWVESDIEETNPETPLMEQASLENVITSVGYGNIKPGVSLQYIASGSSLKEYILVNERQDSYQYTFEMNLGNLEAQMQEDGSISLFDPVTEKNVYSIPASYMTDAAGNYSNAVEMALTDIGNGKYLLTLIADTGWINAEERVFPVQIDPSLNVEMSSDNILRGSYVMAAHPEDQGEDTTVNNGAMLVGFDSSGNEEMITYIQLRNLTNIPKNSVICGAKFYLYGYQFTSIAHPSLHIALREVVQTTNWGDYFTYNSRPQVSSIISDIKTVKEQTPGYIGWDITNIVKNHYEKGNNTGQISAFELRAYDGDIMTYTYCANVYLRIKQTNVVHPVFQVFYRDTKGIESYYTYQTQSIGNAGTAYLGDYTGQITVEKTIATYESTALPYSLGIVYNSAYDNSYFTKTDEIHTKDFSNMILGRGWKLTAQETVTEVSLVNLGTTTNYLIYTDSDGTEHYFKQKEAGSSVYEDEDGLSLTITKNSSSTFTMEDKKNNKKIFTNGYLTTIKDANGNQIHIVYNENQQLKQINSQPNGSSSAVKIFELIYDDNKCLTDIYAFNGTGGKTKKVCFSYTKNGSYQLSQISQYDSSAGSYIPMAQYLYNNPASTASDIYYGMLHAYDCESNYGMQYTYQKCTAGYRIYTFQEYTAESINHTDKTLGELVRCYSKNLGQNFYRNAGADGILQDTTVIGADDITTLYLFNSAGQTVNIKTEDHDGNILGITASAYEKNEGTSKKNNHMKETASTGQVGVNLLENGGFETYTATTATNWTHSSNGGFVACRPSNTTYGTSLSGDMHYNLYNSSTSGNTAIYQDISVEKGKTYTFSAYVNTRYAAEFAADGGVSLYVLFPGNEDIAESPWISHVTDTAIDDGWQRLSTTFTADGTYTLRFFIRWKKAYGTLMVDNVQLEEGNAATGFNYVNNGTFESGKDSWTVSSGGAVSTIDKRQGSSSLRMTGGPAVSATAVQEIKLNKSSNTTFILSGWAKGNSVADLETEIADKTDTSLKYWGMTLILNYSDGTKDYYNLPFSSYVTSWQYAAMSITPKSSNNTIETATLTLHYQNNANTTYFDNISFIEEPAQTFTYDDDGNLKSVKSSESNESYNYDSSTQNLMSIVTEGSGTYKYDYQTTGNTHLPVSVTNDTTTMDISYTAQGESKETKLRNNTVSNGLTITSSATYNDGLMSTATDNTGAITSYTYDANRRLFAVTDAAGESICTLYNDLTDRVKMTYKSGYISIGYDYTDGNLTAINRSGFKSASSATRLKQTYNFSYDEWGNRTGISIGSNIPLSNYEYSDDAYSLLEKVTYGDSEEPLASIDYTYDKLGRTTDITYTDSNSGEQTVCGYQYSADGNLAGIEKNGELVYTYDYDSLGRLIHSSALEDGKMVLYTDHEYDTSDRILRQSWQVDEDGYEETYSYNDKDGTLSQMTATGGDKFTFSYDSLKRLSSKTLINEADDGTSLLKVNYNYRNLDSTQTTTQIESMTFTSPTYSSIHRVPQLTYSYDDVGNITKILSGTDTLAEYTYDSQNQLISEDDGTYLTEYNYDTYGNIRSIWVRSSDTYSAVLETYEFVYDDSGEWKDLLTGINYTDLMGNGSASGTLTYDAIGNPLTYFNGHKNWNFTWKYGRQLASATDGTHTITNTYDVDGIRKTKTVDGVEHEYVTLDGKIIRETYGNVRVDYFYDNDGNPYKLTVDDDTTSSGKYTGYYVLNQQGDVIAILNANGAKVVDYEYNAWGQIKDETASSTKPGALFLQYNALKYRGYYYDTDLGMYYLSNRFYDPVICRFINADDSIAGIGGAMLGCNMYTYCFNNPISYDDQDGNWPKWIKNAAKKVKTVIRKTAGTIKKISKKINNLKKYVRNKINECATYAKTKCRQIYQNETSTLVYKSIGAKEGATIYNSYKVKNPIIMYAYIANNRKGDITGSNTGAVYEWMVHNLAYDTGEILKNMGFSDMGTYLTDHGQDVSLGSTIYDDDTHGGLSVLMKGSYSGLLGGIAAYDLVVEIFE